PDVCSSDLFGPIGELPQTLHAQPAIFTCNAAALAVLSSRGVTPDVVAGHSVGEFSALLCAGVLTFEDAVTAVHRRAQLMSSVATPGAMSGVIGLSEQQVAELCEASAVLGPIGIGLCNGPEFVVISGAKEAVDDCGRRATEAGALKVISLAVSHAF